MGSTPSKDSESLQLADEQASQRSDESPSTTAPACPVAPGRSGPVYNVYSQQIRKPPLVKRDVFKLLSNPLRTHPTNSVLPSASVCPLPESVRGTSLLDLRNNMPLQPNQQPAPGQLKPLSTFRLQSTIPKGGTETTWQYPSPQMFYNVPFTGAALKRKNKAEDVTEDDMESVVVAHNTMNELTWARVQMWEAIHRHECDDCRLRRFMGRPNDLSPLARIHSWFGGQLPFDRHDWFVDRCGKEVRYVIDFYFHDEKAGTPEAFSIRARPAVDSVEAVVDRVKMRIYTTFAKYGLPCPITGSPSTFGAGEADSPADQQNQPV